VLPPGHNACRFGGASEGKRSPLGLAIERSAADFPAVVFRDHDAG